MINIPGCLVIRIINGKYGEFRVGQLQTEIGEFSVKDPMFDQYDEGRYDGIFCISRIYSGPYTISNRVVVQLCADIHSVDLFSENIEQQESESFEQDPIEKEQDSPALVDNEQDLPESEDVGDLGYSSQPDTDDSDPDAEMRKLFGTMWPLDQSVKLDSSVDRQTFRLRRDKLLELGYRFKAMGQVWLKSDPESD